MSSMNPFSDVIDWLDTEEGLQWCAENFRLIGHAYQIAPIEGSDDQYETAFRFATVKVDGKLCSIIDNPEHCGCTESSMTWNPNWVYSEQGSLLPAIEGEMPSCP